MNEPISKALAEHASEHASEMERRKARQLDYHKIPEIKAAIERNNKMMAEGEAVAHWFAYKPGTKLELTVEVIDTQLAQVMIGSAFSDAPLMPGLQITGVRFDDLEHKDAVRAWLRQQIDALR